LYFYLGGQVGIKIDLPFSMGHFDPLTFEPVYNHPVLVIGSSYSNLSYQVREWLIERSIVYNFKPSASFEGYYIEFENQTDATAFRLKWL